MITEPINPADAPIRMKMIENPSTKKMLCKKVGHILLFSSVPIADEPARFARYAGTNGSTQGEKNDRMPAMNAVQ